MKGVETGAHPRESLDRDERVEVHERPLQTVPDIAKLQKLIDDFVALNLPKEVEAFYHADRISAIREITRFLAAFYSELGIAHDRVTTSLGKADESGYYHSQGMALPSSKYILQNARRVVALEKKNPGSVVYLYEQRGIRNFARYSVDFWQRQYTERTSELPYMLVIVPSALGKSTLTKTSVYSELSSGLADLSRPHVMRMIEVNDLSDIFRLLVRMNKEYNGSGQNPISLVLYDGHGTSERLYLGGYSGKSIFGSQHVNSSRFVNLFEKYLSKAFAPRSQFIFASCEAARGPASFAMVFKSVLQSIMGSRVSVTASAQDVSAFSDIIPSLKKNGPLRLTCEFYSTEDSGYGEGDTRSRFRDL